MMGDPDGAEQPLRRKEHTVKRGGEGITRRDLLRAGTAAGLGLALSGGLDSSVRAAFGAAKEINVILITVDTLRADHLGVYGYARDTSPNVDRFARENALFRRAFSHAPETNPSFSSIMTSHYPHETKVFRFFTVLPPGTLTLAKIMQANGYRTAAINSHFTLRRGSGFEQGFDLYDDHLEDVLSERLTRIAPKTTRAAVEWLEENHQKQKFFLWVHYDDPHGPYVPPPPYNTMFVERQSGGKKKLPIHEWSGKGGIPAYQVSGEHREPPYYIAQYDGAIRFFDAAFGTLMKKIQDLGLFENSLVILTADHGEGMGEHDYYFAHEEFVYNTLINIPLIVRPPGKASSGKEIRSPVAHVDVLPTILDIVGVKVSQRFRGQNLFIAGVEREIFSEGHTAGSKYSLIRNGMKLIESEGKFEFYDLAKDFAENVNVIAQEKLLDDKRFATLNDLKKRLDAIRRQDALNLGKPVIWTMDSATTKKLRSLGYVQ
jgi:arylsulfatase A-like enzyme